MGLNQTASKPMNFFLSMAVNNGQAVYKICNFIFWNTTKKQHLSHSKVPKLPKLNTEFHNHCCTVINLKNLTSMIGYC
jgi:hypothetical protein